jgi:hypothetical protein
MKIIIEGTNNQKYFEKENESSNWEYVNTAPKYLGKEDSETTTEEVNNAKKFITILIGIEKMTKKKRLQE